VVDTVLGGLPPGHADPKELLSERGLAARAAAEAPSTCIIGRSAIFELGVFGPCTMIVGPASLQKGVRKVPLPYVGTIRI
jgi:hypothetical protein